MAFTAEDRAEIVELSARCLRAFDVSEMQVWSQCFGEEGVYETSPENRIQGRKALQDFASELDFEIPIRHIPSAIWVQGEGESASVLSYFTLMTLGNAPETIGVGRFEDRMGKENGAWKFMHRRVRMDWTKGD
ncbi:nuclear transport factor 2 family protein [Myxococcota bacterium]|nr:nuclear transport factor 2 family protein [Myxococcota bacterium]